MERATGLNNVLMSVFFFIETVGTDTTGLHHSDTAGQQPLPRDFQFPRSRAKSDYWFLVLSSSSRRLAQSGLQNMVINSRNN